MYPFPKRAGALGLAVALAGLVAGPAPAATVTNVDGTMTFADSGTENNLPLLRYLETETGSPQVEITDPGAPITALGTCLNVAANPNKVRCSVVTTVILQLGAGEDTAGPEPGGWATLSAAPPAVTFDGGAGADVLNGTAFADTLRGGSGEDAHSGAGGDDVLDGGTGPDALDGGDGRDRVTYATRSATVLAGVGGVPNGDGEAGEGDTIGLDVEDLTGGTGADTLVGDADANALDGGAGADRLEGNAGNDTLTGGPSGLGTDSADVLVGGTGDDALAGGNGIDTVSYEDRTDPTAAVTATVNGAGGVAGEADALSTVETLRGGAGADTLTGDAGANALEGGAGDDTLRGEATGTASPGDVFAGGAGVDTVTYAARAAEAPVTVTIGSGADDGAPSEDDDLQSTVENVVGGAGADTLTGDGAANRLDGGGGDDTLDGGLGGDLLIGGGQAGDVATYAARTAAVAVTLGAGADDGEPGEGDDVRTTDVQGGAGADQLVGDTGANDLRGGAGDDRLDGGAGSDLLDGQAGSHDVADFSAPAPARTGVTVTLDSAAGDGTAAVDGSGEDVRTEDVRGSAADDILTGDGGPNLLDGGAGADTLDGRQGDDLLEGGIGGDSLVGGAGVDAVSYATRTASVQADADGTAGDDGQGCPGASCEADGIATDVEGIAGGSADDDLTGGTTASILSGGAGDDVLDGGPGAIADVLIGGDGHDTATYRGRTAAITASLDGAANDGATGEADGIASDVERLTGGDAGDQLSGGPGVNVLTGGPGADHLLARDAAADHLSCGDGSDTATADRLDTFAGCEALDRGALPVVSVTGGSVNEGAGGRTSLRFQVTVTGATRDDVTVHYATQQGSAVPGEDYATAAGDLTFAAGETSKDVVVEVLGDTAFEGDEALDLVLSAPSEASLGIARAAGVVVNDDAAPPAPAQPQPALSIADARVREGAKGRTAKLVFVATLDKVADVPVTTRYVARNIKARDGEDYAAVAGTLTFAPGERAKQVVVRVKGDDRRETDETLALLMADTVNARLVRAVAQGTIEDDDAGRSTRSRACVVPRLEGRTLTSAKTLLRRAGCGYRRSARRASGAVQAGRVVTTTPQAGARRSPGTKVLVVVSAGRPPA